MGVMEAGTNRSRGESENFGDLARLVANVVAEHEDGALVGGQPAEAAVELVSICDAQQLVLSGGPFHRKHVKIVDALPLPAGLCDADIREEPVDPGVEPVRIAEVRQVTPGDHQCVLQGILGPVDIPKDSMRDSEEPTAAKLDQVDERRLVASHCRLDEIAIHFTTVMDVHWERLPEYWFAPVAER